MFSLALAYESGDVGEPDYSQAAEWIRRGAEAGDVDAKVTLAFLYKAGMGVERDVQRGEALLREVSRAERAAAGERHPIVRHGVQVRDGGDGGAPKEATCLFSQAVLASRRGEDWTGRPGKDIHAAYTIGTSLSVTLA
jgi:TPR repeat protein